MEKVFKLWLEFFCAMAVIKELSIPPDNITPNGTSLSKRFTVAFSIKFSIAISNSNEEE